jgi:hypothetical protein
MTTTAKVPGGDFFVATWTEPCPELRLADPNPQHPNHRIKCFSTFASSGLSKTPLARAKGSVFRAPAEPVGFKDRTFPLPRNRTDRVLSMMIS